MYNRVDSSRSSDVAVSAPVRSSGTTVTVLCAPVAGSRSVDSTPLIANSGVPGKRRSNSPRMISTTLPAWPPLTWLPSVVSGAHEAISSMSAPGVGQNRANDVPR